MDLCLTRDTCGFAEEGGNGGGGVDAVASGPAALYGGVINSCCYELQWSHAWGQKVEVGDVRLQIQVIDGLNPLGILTGDNVGVYGGAEC